MRTVPMIVTMRPCCSGSYVSFWHGSQEDSITDGWPDTSSSENVAKSSETDLTDDTSQVCSSFDGTTFQGDLVDSTRAFVEEQDIEDRDDQVDGEQVVCVDEETGGSDEQKLRLMPAREKALAAIASLS